MHIRQTPIATKGNTDDDQNYPPHAGGATEFVDPRLTALENDAVRALVQRFEDAFDEQVCYLDVWITLYHAVFRSGKVRGHGLCCCLRFILKNVSKALRSSFFQNMLR